MGWVNEPASCLSSRSKLGVVGGSVAASQPGPRPRPADGSGKSSERDCNLDRSAKAHIQLWVQGYNLVVWHLRLPVKISE